LSAVQEVERDYGIPVIAVASLQDLMAFLEGRPDLAASGLPSAPIGTVTVWRPASLLLLLLTALPAGAGSSTAVRMPMATRVRRHGAALCQKRGYQELNPQGGVTPKWKAN
jgi:hypothetical protein